MFGSFRSALRARIKAKEPDIQKGFEEQFGETISKKLSGELFEYIKTEVKSGTMSKFLSEDSLEELEKEVKTPDAAAITKKGLKQIDISAMTWADMCDQDIDLNVLISSSETTKVVENKEIVIPKGTPKGLQSIISKHVDALELDLTESEDLVWSSKEDSIFESPSSIRSFFENEKDPSKLAAVKLLLKLLRGIPIIGDPLASENDQKVVIFTAHVQLLQLSTVLKDYEMKDTIDHIIGTIGDSRKRAADQLTHFIGEKCVELLLRSIETLIRKNLVKNVDVNNKELLLKQVKDLVDTVEALKPSKRAILQSYFKTTSKDVDIETVGKNGKKVITKERRTFIVTPQIRTHQIELSGPEKDLITIINESIKSDSIIDYINRDRKPRDIFGFAEISKESVSSLNEFCDRVSKLYSLERDIVKQQARDLQNKSEADKSKKELLPHYFNQVSLAYKREPKLFVPLSEWFKKDWKDLDEIPQKNIDWSSSVINRKIEKNEES